MNFKSFLQCWRWWYVSNLPFRKETIDHIISGCDGLSPLKYLECHKYIHVLLPLEHRFFKKYIPWYQHQPAQVTENNSTKILWNILIQTDHEVINNKPKIIVVDKINKTVNLNEVAVPNDYNICNKNILQRIWWWHLKNWFNKPQIPNLESTKNCLTGYCSCLRSFLQIV